MARDTAQLDSARTQEQRYHTRPDTELIASDDVAVETLAERRWRRRSAP